MPLTPAPGIRIAYDTIGSGGPTLVLIAGLGRQLIDWDREFCEKLAGTGISVVRMDNRDVGLSSRVAAGKVNLPALARAREAGEPLDVPYTLDDMAGDVVRVLDHLGVGSAHVAGVSMGGRIAQLAAIGQPDRVDGLVSIASTTGASDVGQPTARGEEALFMTPPPVPAGAIESQLAARRLLAAEGTFDEAWERSRVTAEVARSFDPAGVGRQLAAIWAETDRTPALSTVRIPALVIHGAADPLIGVSGGRATAAAIPDARYLEIAGLGHDLPPWTWPVVIPALAQHVHT